MPKTKNTFALRDVAAKIQAANSKLRVDDFSDTILNQDEINLQIAGVIENWVGTATRSIRPIAGTKGVEFELRVLENDLDKLQKKIERVDAHILQLQNYLERIVDRLISGNDNAVMRARASRAKQIYSWYERIRNELMRVVDATEELVTNSRDRLPVEFKKDFGGRLKIAREKANLSLKRVAQELDLTYTGYCQYERGLREPPLWTIRMLAELYNVSTDWLFGLKN